MSTTNLTQKLIKLTEPCEIVVSSVVSYNDFISSNPVQLNMTKIKRKKYSRQLFAPNLNNNAKKALEKIQGFNGILFGGLGQPSRYATLVSKCPEDSHNINIYVGISYE